MGNPFKKAFDTVTKPFKKAAKKLIPKEIAGIMQVAAPFTGAAAPFVYAAGAYKQSGRINPIALASMALPYVGQVRGQGLGGLRYGRFDPSQLGGGMGQIRTARDLLRLRNAEGLRGRAEDFLFGGTEPGKIGRIDGGYDRTLAEAQISPPKDFQGILGKGGDFDLVGGKLLSKESGKLSYGKVAAAAAAGLSLTQTQSQIEEEADEAGLSSGELARLQQEAAEMWEDFDTTAFRPKITAAIGGLMRKNLANGTFNPATPKPEDYGIEDNELPADPKPFRPKPNVGKIVEASPMSILNDMAIQLFGKPLDELDDRQKEMIMSFMKPKAQQGGLMRANYALGTKPTKEESGLGGLPIEADMRYTGGFMPYGAKEKADDVPARLSKNEFVFTADAVRAAGGGSVQKGAQKMYNSMKQLESMGRRMA
jgi:hypothetical protein